MKIRKLVILAAGMGTRFLPITKGVSKEMLPLYDKPAIQYLVDEAKLCGIEEIFIVIANKREALKHYFEKDEVLEQRLLETNKLDFLNIVKDVSSVKVTYIMQEEALGSGYALSLAKPYVGDEDFAVMYCDDIVKGVPALKEVIDVYNNTGNNVMAAVSVRHEDTYKYGILEIDKNMKVISLVEKPKVEEAPSNLASIGRLILKKDIFDITDYYWHDGIDIATENKAQKFIEMFDNENQSAIECYPVFKRYANNIIGNDVLEIVHQEYGENVVAVIKFKKSDGGVGYIIKKNKTKMRLADTISDIISEIKSYTK